MTAVKDLFSFDDLETEVSSIPVVSSLPETIEDASKNKSGKKDGEWFIEPCGKCGGSGVYKAPSSYGHRCFACDGKGTVRYRKSKAQRAAEREKRTAAKEAKADKQLADFEADNPDIAEWWTDSDFGFAISLREAARKYGYLTEGQLAAARKAIASLAQARAAKAEREAEQAERIRAMPVLDLSAITDAMNHAKGNGLKRPKMRLLAGSEGFILSFAPDTGKWGGSLYLKSPEGDYLGRITAGKFYRSREVSAELEAEIVKACQAPLEAAIAYGRETGSCSCCGRELSDPESIARGIGPICADKFFGA